MTEGEEAKESLLKWVVGLLVFPLVVTFFAVVVFPQCCAPPEPCDSDVVTELSRLLPDSLTVFQGNYEVAYEKGPLTLEERSHERNRLYDKIIPLLEVLISTKCLSEEGMTEARWLVENLRDIAVCGYEESDSDGRVARGWCEEGKRKALQDRYYHARTKILGLS